MNHPPKLTEGRHQHDADMRNLGVYDEEEQEIDLDAETPVRPTDKKRQNSVTFVSPLAEDHYSAEKAHKSELGLDYDKYASRA